MSGVSKGLYPTTEILNLSRFIAVMKFRPLTWRSTHPYLLADRMEDISDPADVISDPSCDRHISVYGWVRGTSFKSGSLVHIPGVGDFTLHSITSLPDPCPSPQQDPEKRKKKLNEKEKLLYAPMTDVGSVVYDKDATIMEIGHIHQNESSDLVDQLKTQALDQRNPGLRLFANSAILTEEEVEKAEKCATSPYICFYFNFFFSYVFFLDKRSEIFFLLFFLCFF